MNPIIILICAPAFLMGGQFPLPVQDISGGASMIIVRPRNPPVRHRPHPRKPLPDDRTSQTSESQPKVDPARTAQTNGVSPDEVEDALELGNSARDGKPPRYQYAEHAYKLAAKLNPRDSRPYIGLGNILYDQKMYAEAADVYKKVISSMQTVAQVQPAPPRRAPTRGSSSGIREKITVGRNSGFLTAPSITDHELHGWLGETFLGQGKLEDAEHELRQAVVQSSNDPQWHALLGFTLFAHKRYAEASAEYEEALKHSRGNSELEKEYKKLLKQTRREEEKQR